MRLPQDRILHIGTELKDGKVNIVAEWQGELVRCKDCRYRKKVGTSYYCELDEFNVKDADFCSWGEKTKPEVIITDTDIMYVGENYKV